MKPSVAEGRKAQAMERIERKLDLVMAKLGLTDEAPVEPIVEEPVVVEPEPEVPPAPEAEPEVKTKGRGKYKK